MQDAAFQFLERVDGHVAWPASSGRYRSTSRSACSDPCRRPAPFPGGQLCGWLCSAILMLYSVQSLSWSVVGHDLGDEHLDAHLLGPLEDLARACSLVGTPATPIGDDLQPARVGQLLLDLVAHARRSCCCRGGVRAGLELLAGVHLQILDPQARRLCRSVSKNVSCRSVQHCNDSLKPNFSEAESSRLPAAGLAAKHGSATMVNNSATRAEWRSLMGSSLKGNELAGQATCDSRTETVRAERWPLSQADGAPARLGTSCANIACRDRLTALSRSDSGL